uniref:Uncharacterized protein n=1 Tax=Arion vulgaris TaxID=1028688 RepID=A0A0B6ZSG4_9EUPU
MNLEHNKKTSNEVEMEAYKSSANKNKSDQKGYIFFMFKVTLLAVRSVLLTRALSDFNNDV